MMDYKLILDVYWPVIEACIDIQADYAGKLNNKHKDKPRVAPDSVGYMVNTLIKARKQIPLKREIIQVED
jgi:hypothetical protein